MSPLINIVEPIQSTVHELNINFRSVKSEVVPSNEILNKFDYRVYCIPTVHELEIITQANSVAI